MTDAAQLCPTLKISARKIPCPVKGAGSSKRPDQKTSLFPKIRATDTGLPPASSPNYAKAIRQAVWPKLKAKAIRAGYSGRIGFPM